MEAGAVWRVQRGVRGVRWVAVLVLLFGLLASAPGWAQAGPDAPPGTDTGTQPTATVICPLGTDPAPGGPGQGTPGGPTGPDTPGQGTPGEPGGPGQGTPGGPNGPDTPGQGTPGGTTGSDPQPTVACPPETFGSISATPTVCNIDPVSGSCSTTITWGASGTTVAQVWRRNLVTGSNTLFASAGSGQGSQVASGIDTQTVRFELLLDGVFEASVDVVGNPGPSVSLSAPLGGAVVTANAGATLTASASDADGVSQVAFFDGATLLGTDTSAPYSLSWVPTVLGSHTLSAQATDARGAVTSTAGVVVTVVRVKLTASNKTVSSTVAFGNTASATFRLATAGKIRFQTSAGGTYDEQSPFDEWLEPESATSGAQFEVQAVPVSGAVSAGTVNQWWSLGNATPRDWTLTRTAAGTSQAVINVQLRQAGTSTVLASTNVTLNATVTAPPNGAPVVSLTAPANGSVFTAPATLTLTATASDSDGTISQVAFFNGTTLLPGTQSNPNPDSSAPYAYTWSGVAAGSYTLKATATDNAGGTGSSTVTVIVNAPPSVTMPTPAIQNAPCTWALSASASDSDGTIGQVQFFNGAVALPGTTGNLNPDTSAPYSYTWSAVPAGTYTLTAKATDNRGAITASVPVTAVCNALPAIDITAPVAGSTQPTSFDLTATATDSDGSIASVQFFEGTTAIHPTPLTTAPYTFRWNNVALGSHTVTAKAIDNRGAIKTSNSVTFTVADVPPTATLTAPANGASYIRPDGPIVSATASTSAGTISKVEFFDNGVTLGEDITSPYTYPVNGAKWDTTNVAAGSHSLTARATNSLGTVGPLSTPVTITLLNPNPAVTLTSPSNGASFAEKTPIPLAASASIALGNITQVEFFDGAVRIGLPDTSAPYAITDWTTATIGTHVLTAKATSSLSTSKVSTAVTITVTNPAPSITLTAPSAGANFAAPAAITLSATASDANGTISKVEFFKDDGATKLGEALAPPYTYEWRDVPVGNYTITAKATDNLNASTSTPAIAISVTAFGPEQVPDQPLVSLAAELPAHAPGVGATPGEAAASGGAAAYEIPIALPPGRRGVQPSLALSYSSRAGNGVAGMGFSLSGLSSVHRCPQTLEQDGQIRAVAYSNEDRLCLDGQRLMATAGAYGQSGTTYATEIDSFVRVTQQGGDLTAGATYFKVEYKSGEVAYFGGLSVAANAARVVASGANAPLSWLVERRRDPMGNEVRYAYLALGDGETLINQIFYTGFNGADGTRRVDFAYALRPAGASGNDQSSSYLAGSLSRQTRRLSTITTWADNAKVREYQLAYAVSATSARSLLRSVTECGFDGAASACLSPTTFSWQEGAPTQVLRPLALPPALTAPALDNSNRRLPNSISVLGDLDGDGSRELLYSRPSTTVADALETHILSLTPDRQVRTAIPATDLGLKAGRRQPADFDRDGRTDLVHYDGFDSEIEILFWDGPATATKADLAFTRRWNTGIAGFAFWMIAQDIDGDARADIAVELDNPAGADSCRRLLRVYRNVANPAGGAAPATFVPYPDVCLAGVIPPAGSGLNSYEDPVDVRDLNGDGLPDITLLATEVDANNGRHPGRILYGSRNSAGGYVQVSRPFASLFPINDFPNDEEINEKTYHTWLDINGDGLDDRLFVRTEGGFGRWTLRLNTGNGLGPRVLLSSGLGIEFCDAIDCDTHWQPRYAARFQIDDIDGDGRAELLIPRRFATRVCREIFNFPPGEPTAVRESAVFCPEDPATDALDGVGWGYASDADGDGLLDDQNRDGAITAADVVPVLAGAQRLYRSGKGAIDDSSYFMDAVRFVETGPNAYSLQSTATQIVTGPSSGSSLGAGSTLLAEDFYGDGLPDTAIRPSCSWTGENQCLVPIVDGAGNPLPASISPRTLPGGLALLSPDILVNENRGIGALSPDGKTPQLPDLLKMTVDGLGNQALWTYYPLASAAGRAAGDLPLYSVPGPGAARYLDERHIYFTSSMPVVSTFIRSDGVGGLRSWSYGYREAMYHQTGRGMQGFRTLIEEDDAAGLRTTTTFHQKFPLTGQVEQVVVNPIARDGEAGTIRSEDQVWRCNRANRADATACQAIPTPGQVWFPYLDSRETKIFDASAALSGTPALISRTLEVNADDATCEGAFATASGFDAYGNLSARTQLTFDEGDGSAGFERFVALHCQRTRSSYTANTANWWLDQVTQSATTTHQTFGAAHALPAGASAPDQTQVTTFTWNANRTPASQTLQPGITGQTRTTSFAYPATNYGLPSAVTVSAAGDVHGSRTTSTTYSPDGYFPQTVSNPLGQSSTTLTRSRDGQPGQSSDLQNHLTRFSYDVFGRSVRAEFLGSDGITRLQPDQRMALSASSGGYQITSVQDGAPTQLSRFDALGRVIKTQTKLPDGGWSSVDTQYDALGRQVATSAPYRSSPVFTQISGFDLAGRPLGKTAPADGDDGNASRVTTYSYVGRETRIHVCGNVGGVCLDMRRNQDSLGRFVRTVDAQGGLTRTWADGNGNVVALQDVAGSTIKASYNALGQRTAVNDPNQGASSFGYNALGEVLSSTDGRGISTSNSYDKLGRLIGRSANVDVDGIGGADSVQDVWSYDPVGAAGALDFSRRTIAGTVEREEHHSYDPHGRRLQTDTTQAVNLGTRSYTQRFAYDASYGRLKARSLPHLSTASGEVIWTRYSAYGHPTRESDGLTGVDYRQITAVDASGQPTQELLGGHWQSSTGRREATGSVTGVSHAFDGALQRDIDYRYDVYGNLTEQALDGGAVIESLQYDTLHRLTQTARSGSASGTVNYGYDAAGNFQYKSDFSTALSGAYSYSGGACGGGPNAVKSVQLKAGGSRSYCYDGAGNLTSDNSGMSLRYDASQRPTVMHRGTADSQFRYGPDGDKARQWGSSGQRLYVAGLEDRPDTGETESYLGDYALIQTSPSGRKVQYLLRDRLGSVIGVADDAGTVEWRGFDAFGAPRSGTWADKSPNILGPSTATAHGFTQHEHLDGLGLIHMNGRVYDYALGRFLGVDPFIQFPSNSQSLNPYSYILNNPLAGTDPTGYAACGDISSGDPGSGTCDFTQDGVTTEVNFSVGSNGTVAVAGKGVSTSVLSGLVSTGVLRSDSGASAGTGARGDSNTGKSTSDIGNTRGTASNPTQLPPVKAVIGSRADLATGREANAAGDVVGGLVNIILENAPLTSDAIAINEFRKDPTFANGLVAVVGAVPLLGDRIAPGLRAALRSSDEVAGAADGVGDASSVVNSVRLRGQLAGQEIAGGHAFEKHVLQRGEFAGLGIRTRAQFASHIEGAVNNPTAVRQLGGGRTAYWHEGSGTVVIRNPRAADGGTAFQPLFGRSYFDGLR